MLIVALVLAVIGLAALVTAVVTSNEVIAWVCIGASAVGVVLLIVDALRDRSTGDSAEETGDESVEDTGPAESADDVEDYPDEPPVADYADEPFLPADASPAESAAEPEGGPAAPADEAAADAADEPAGAEHQGGEDTTKS